MERFSSFRPHPLATALALAVAVLAATPALAQHLGNPAMRVHTYRITPPYAADFDTSVVQANWPAVHFHAQQTEANKDVGGRIELYSVYDANSFADDIASAWADDTGLLGAYSRRDDTYSWDEYCGVLTSGTWAQSFRKDSANATLDLHLTGAEAYVVALFGEARAEFTFESHATRNGTTFHMHREAAAVRATFGFPTTFDEIVTGQMAMTASNPNGNGSDRMLTFAAVTLPVDLSSVPVGQEFTLRCNLVTEATIGISEVARAHVAFGNEAARSGGLQLSTFGLTPMDDPELPPDPLAVGPGATAHGRLALSSPRPNPSPAGASFELALGSAGEVALEVFDMAGRRVASLARGRFEAGRHMLSWDGRDAAGQPAAPGVYTARAAANGEVVSRRVVKLAAAR